MSDLANLIDALIDRDIVSDYANSYGEPGYRSDGPILLGNWWCGRPACKGASLHSIFEHYPRIERFLNDKGCSFEWYDEWMVDYESGKAYRTQPDSYSWQPSAVWTENYEWITPDTDADTVVEWANRNPRVAIPATIATAADLIRIGFSEDGDHYESGWHPGQNADPVEIMDRAVSEHDDTTELVFHLSGVGQFDMRFQLYYRREEDR